MIKKKITEPLVELVWAVFNIWFSIFNWWLYRGIVCYEVVVVLDYLDIQQD